MLYINTKTLEYPINFSKLKTIYNNVAFSTPPESYGDHTKVYDGAVPQLTAAQFAEEGKPAMVDGQWQRTWVVFEYTAEQIAMRQQVQQEALQREIVEATQRRLDDFAKTRNYDGILSAATYASSTNTTFQAEGQRAVQLRDDTWQALYNILGQVATQGRVVTKFEDIEGDLPVLSWT